MFDHVTIRVSNRATSQGFYGTVLPTLGLGNAGLADPDLLSYHESYYGAFVLDPDSNGVEVVTTTATSRNV